MKKLFVSLFFLLITACFVGGLNLWITHTNPELVWDTSPNSIVIEYERRYEIDYNYIPLFRIWGDGHIIWVKYAPSGERKVLEGYLSEEQISSLLEKFKDARFFKECYKNQNYALDYVRINLLETSCSALIGSEENLKTSILVDELMSGVGINGKEFIPEIGYLYVVQYENTMAFQYDPDIQPEFIWSEERYGTNLATISTRGLNGQIEITGEELLFAWEIVNSPNALVTSSGKNYWIAVIIPQITE